MHVREPEVSDPWPASFETVAINPLASDTVYIVHSAEPVGRLNASFKRSTP